MLAAIIILLLFILSDSVDIHITQSRASLEKINDLKRKKSTRFKINSFRFSFVE